MNTYSCLLISSRFVHTVCMHEICILVVGISEYIRD